MRPATRAGFQNVVPFLSVRDAPRLVEFLIRTFGATQTYSSPGHAEVRVGDSMIMIGDVGAGTPMTGQLFSYVEDAEAVHRSALAAGASTSMPPCDKPWGDGDALVRAVGFVDPHGLAIAYVVFALELFLAFAYGPSFRGMLAARGQTRWS
jgi:uncharacterized glyoxalase superfamily protein PhnB